MKFRIYSSSKNSTNKIGELECTQEEAPREFSLFLKKQFKLQFFDDIDEATTEKVLKQNGKIVWREGESRCKMKATHNDNQEIYFERV